MSLVWCDPPPYGKRPWLATLNPVTERPGVWALVRTYPRHSAAVDAVRQLRKAALGKGNVRIPPGKWEFQQGQPEPDTATWGVWAKYIGPE